MMCVRWFRLQYPELAPLLFAVPNGGKRNAREAERFKAEGVTAGVADLLLLKPYYGYANDDPPSSHALCIEMKWGKGRQSEHQRAWQEAVTAQGYRYEVVRSFEDFQALIQEYIGKRSSHT